MAKQDLAYREDVGCISLVAEGDLTGKMFHVMQQGTAGNQVKIAGASTEQMGVLTNEPLAGEAAKVEYRGVTKVICGGAVAKGPVQSGADGKIITLAAGTKIGTALTSGVAGQIISVMLKLS